MRRDLEPHFGHSFAQVRIHTDERAAESARSLDALAYTVGRHIVFGAGLYAPATPAGRRLLAHELVHVVQQQATASSRAGSEQVQRKASGEVANDAYPGCSQAKTGDPDPERVIDRARIDARVMVGVALEALQTPGSQDLLDRHFRCPSGADVERIRANFQLIDTLLSRAVVTCSARRDPEGFAGNDASDKVELYPSFFKMPSSEHQASALVIAVAHTPTMGTLEDCRIRDPCYSHSPPAILVKNPYSYGYFAFEAQGDALDSPTLRPCRPRPAGNPKRAGIYVVVPPDAAADPSKIRRVSGYERAPAGSVILDVFRDDAGEPFIYFSGIEGGRTYGPGERERYYFPDGKPPD